MFSSNAVACLALPEDAGIEGAGLISYVGPGQGMGYTSEDTDWNAPYCHVAPARP
jgi:hypothetical protein